MMPINWRPSAKDLRIFAGLQILFFALISFVLFRRTGRWEWGTVIMAVSLVVGLIGLVCPTKIRIVYVGWMLAVFPIGWVVSHAVLGFVFLGIVTPVGLVLRWTGYDPLQLHRRNTPTYWRERSGRRDIGRYFRQF